MLTGCASRCLRAPTGCVLVASFSAKVNVSGQGLRSGWIEHESLPQVYIPGPPRAQSLQARALAEARQARKAKKAEAETGVPGVYK